MWDTFLNVLTILLFLILVNGMLALLIRSLPANLFDENRLVYKIKPWEKRFYRRFGVHKWKNILPQAGSMTGFSRKRLPNVIDVAYAERFIWEICCAMLGHFIMAFAGLLAPLIVLLQWVNNNAAWLIGLWCLAVVHFIIQLLYVMIQRYNLPRFIWFKKRLLKQQLHGEDK